MKFLSLALCALAAAARGEKPSGDSPSEEHLLRGNAGTERKTMVSGEIRAVSNDEEIRSRGVSNDEDIRSETCSPNKRVTITEFCPNSSGENGYQLSVEDQKDVEARNLMNGECSEKGSLTAVVAAGKTINIGADEIRPGGTVEDYSVALTGESWYDHTCGSYNIVVSTKIDDENGASACWTLVDGEGPQNLDIPECASSGHGMVDNGLTWHLEIAPEIDPSGYMQAKKGSPAGMLKQTRGSEPRAILCETEVYLREAGTKNHLGKNKNGYVLASGSKGRYKFMLEQKCGERLHEGDVIKLYSQDHNMYVYETAAGNAGFDRSASNDTFLWRIDKVDWGGRSIKIGDEIILQNVYYGGRNYLTDYGEYAAAGEYSHHTWKVELA